MLSVIDLPGRDPAANLAREAELFEELRHEPFPTLLFYVNDPCVVLGRSNREDEWVNAAALQADGVPLLRRISGGGTVYHDLDNLNYSFLLPRALIDNQLSGARATYGPADYIAFFRNIVLRALSRGGGGYAASGVSDITLNGRKISGNAQRIASTMLLHHGTIMLRCPLNAIERYLKVPPNRPGVPHAGFVTGLREEGRFASLADIKHWLAEETRAIPLCSSQQLLPEGHELAG